MFNPSEDDNAKKTSSRDQVPEPFLSKEPTFMEREKPGTVKPQDASVDMVEKADKSYRDAPSIDMRSVDKSMDSHEPLFKIGTSLMAEVDKDQWYHGILPAPDVDDLLANQGDFLLKQFDNENRGFQISMAIRWDKMIYHIPIYTIDIGGSLNYTLNNEVFARTPMDVARIHMTRGLPVYEGVIPIKPIARQAWELRKEHIRLINKIGEGAYGEVWSGMLQVQKTAGMVDVEVAVKLMKMTEETKPQLEKMHQEARLMRQYNHKNVVRLHGCLFSEADVYIVMEMVKGGSLDGYVKKNPQLPPLHRTSFAYDVAAGLAYLHKRNCMHRDIAARNCLVEENGKVVKLSDFGLSVHGRRFTVPQGERVPIRWSAPEVLVHRIYTRESDVWSYGMLVWEIFNDGKEPFVGHDTPFIRANIGKRSFRPPVDHIKWYPELKVLIPKCWEVETPKRPTMERIADNLMKYCIHEVGDDQKNKERVIIRSKEVQQKQAKMPQAKPAPKAKGPIRIGQSLAPVSSSRSGTSHSGNTKSANSQVPGKPSKKGTKKENGSKRAKKDKPKKNTSKGKAGKKTSNESVD